MVNETKEIKNLMIKLSKTFPDTYISVEIELNLYSTNRYVKKYVFYTPIIKHVYFKTLKGLTNYINKLIKNNENRDLQKSSKIS